MGSIIVARRLGARDDAGQIRILTGRALSAHFLTFAALSQLEIAELGITE